MGRKVYNLEDRVMLVRVVSVLVLLVGLSLGLSIQNETFRYSDHFLMKIASESPLEADVDGARPFLGFTNSSSSR